MFSFLEFQDLEATLATISEQLAEEKIPVQHVTNGVAKVLGPKGAVRFLTHLKPGTEKHTSWNKVNDALTSQGVKTHHIAKIATHIKPAQFKEEAGGIEEALTDLQKSVMAARAASVQSNRRKRINTSGSHNERLNQKKDDNDRAARDARKSNNEEVEHIDELSKDTLKKYLDASDKNYINLVKARPKRGSAEHDALIAKIKTRLKGDVLAKKKISMKNEEAESIEELSKPTLASYVNKATTDVHNSRYKAGVASQKPHDDNDDEYKATRKANTRRHGIGQAVNRLAKEEAESIEELSKPTLASYAKKASKDRGWQGVEAGASGSGSDEQKAAVGRMKKRQQGVERAVDRLTKEEASLKEAANVLTHARHLARAALKRVMAKKKVNESSDLEEAKNPADLKDYPDKEHKDHYWSPTGKVGTHIATKKTTYEYERINHEGNKTGDRHWKDARGKYMGESVDLEEAVKLGSKVKIHAPGKSYHGEVGHVGEIRHGAFKGAPKTYTVDYGDRQSIQLDKKNVKLHKEDVSYSADKAREGKDIGKKGKEFSKIASSAAKKYGSKEAGQRVAGAILAKLRKEDLNLDEAVSFSSKAHYEYANGKKPSGHGTWMFSTVHPSKHNIEQHKDQTHSVTGSYSDAAKSATKHFKDQGHKGEIHVLS